MANQYATDTEFKLLHGVQTTEQDSLINLCLQAASRFAEQYCGRQFILDSANVTRILWPQDPTFVDVRDLVTVTSLKVDTTGDRTYATTLLTTDYDLLPTLSGGLVAGRYDTIRIRPTSSRSFSVGKPVQWIGKAGYVEGSTTPPDVKRAVLLQANRLWRRKDSPYGIEQNSNLETFQTIRDMDPDVKNLLAPYRHPRTAASRSWVML